MRKVALGLLLLLSVSAVSADIESDIKSECNQREEAVISISDPQETHSHPAEPGYYDNQLCISGIESSEITEDRCQFATGLYLTGREDEAHFSIFGSYRLNVCTSNMETRLIDDTSESCLENETALFSVSGQDNTHVADVGVFDNKMCGGYITPSNVSLSLKFNHSSGDEVYFDGERVEGEETFRSANYPYMISEGDIMTAGIVKSEFKSASRRIETENVLEMSSGRDSANFIIPYTDGGIEDIENRQEMVVEKEFLNEIQPSFGYLIPESPTVRVVYDPDIELESSISFSPGRYRFDVVKTGENRIGLFTPDERTGN